MDRSQTTLLPGVLSLLLACSASDGGKGAPAETGGTTQTGETGGTTASTDSGGNAGTQQGTQTVGTQTGGAPALGGAASSATQTPPSSGCAVTDSPTGLQESLTIEVGELTREYVLSVPKTYTAATPMPLVFAWHGMGGSGKIARAYFRIEQAAGDNAIFVYPTGLPMEDGSTGWDLTESGIDIALFDALLAKVTKTYCINLERVFSTGHSYGGLMTNALGCYRASVLRAIAPVAGMPPWSGTCTEPIAAWIAHGENDETVDYTRGGVATRDLWTKTNGCGTTTGEVAPSPCVAYENCSDGLPVHWCVHQSGHDWPDFAGKGIWDFFAAQK